jgi:hypothetical protein
MVLPSPNSKANGMTMPVSYGMPRGNMLSHIDCRRPQRDPAGAASRRLPDGAKQIEQQSDPRHLDVDRSSVTG